MRSLSRFISEHKLLCLLVAIALAAHYGILLRYAVDAPIGDDYNDALLFLDNYANADSLIDKLRLVHAQTNEHRTVVNRIVFLVMQQLNGSLDFKALMVLGSLSTIAMIVLLARQFRTRVEAPFMFALIAIFLLNLQSWQSEFWAMTALSNYVVAPLALASFIALTAAARSGVVWAALLAAAATFSMGNGLAVWPIGLLYIALCRRPDRPLRLAVWSIAAIVGLGVYFFHYHFPPASGVPLAAHWSLAQVMRTAKWYLAFLGSCWTFESGNATLGAAVGAGLLLLSVPMGLFLLKRKPALACFIAFVLATGVIVTYSRLAFEPDVALASRYRIYSVYLSALALTTVYLWLAAHPRFATRPQRVRWLQAGFIAVACAHTVATYCTSFEPMRDEQRDVVDSMRRWLLVRTEARFEFNWIPTGSASILRAIETGVWNPRSMFDDSLEFSRVRDSKLCDDLQRYPALPIELRRHDRALMGELLVDDTSLIYYRIRQVVVCQGHVYSAIAYQPSRVFDGRFMVHYLKMDGLERNPIVFVTANGLAYRGVVQP